MYIFLVTLEYTLYVCICEKMNARSEIFSTKKKSNNYVDYSKLYLFPNSGVDIIFF